MKLVLDNREIALVGWTGLLLIFGLVLPAGRAILRQFAAALFKLPIVVLILAMVAYVIGLVILLRRVGFWDLRLLPETVLWFFGPAFTLVSRLDQARTDQAFLRQALLALFKYTLLLEFVMNLRPVGLLVEILLVPILTIVTLLHLMATIREEHRALRVFMEVLLAIFGLSLFLYTVIGVVRSPGQFATFENLLELLVPVLLTLAFVPFVWALAVLATYQRLFSLMNWKLSENPSLARYAKWRLVLATMLRLTRLRQFNQFPWRLTSSMDRAAVGRVVARFQEGDTGPGR